MAKMVEELQLPLLADPSEELGSMGSRKCRLSVVWEVSNSNRLAHHRNGPSQSASLGARNPTLGQAASSLELRLPRAPAWRRICSTVVKTWETTKPLMPTLGNSADPNKKVGVAGVHAFWA